MPPTRATARTPHETALGRAAGHRRSLCAAALLLVLSGAGPVRAAPVETRVTRVVALVHADPTRIAEIYRRLAGPDAQVETEARTRRLVIRDRPDRIDRVLAVVSLLDRADGQTYHVYVRPVVHRTPEDLAALLDPVARATGGCLALLPDSATDQLVVVALPETYRRLDLLARRIDVPEADRQRVWVLPAP